MWKPFIFRSTSVLKGFLRKEPLLRDSKVPIYSQAFFPELNDPARPAAARPVPWARGGRVRGRSAGQTNRHGKSVDQEVHPYPATRRRRTCRGQQRRGLARSVWQGQATR